MKRSSTTSLPVRAYASNTLPPGVDESLSFLARRQMIVPALLFLVGHRPFAFVIGQCLMMSIPLGMICSPWPLRAWAEVLSHPHGPDRLEARLHDFLADRSSTTQSSADEAVPQP